MTDAQTDAQTIDPQEHARLKALVGEMTTQLQEAINARTNMGVSLRLMEAQIRELQQENADLKAPKKRSKKAG